MNIILWVLQVLLALAFAAHGWLFLSPPPEMLEAINASVPPALRLFIGVAEELAALALIVPGIMRRSTWLVPCAAAGLALLMVCAAVLHVVRGETSSAVTTAILLVLTAFVAYMRWKVRPIR